MSLEKLNNREWLHVQYHVQNRSMQDIAQELDTNKQRVRRAMIKQGIVIKGKAEAQKAALMSGRAKHPTLGQTRTEATRQKIAASVAKSWSEMPEEELKARSDKARERWEQMTEAEQEALLQAARAGVRQAAKDGSQLEKFLRDGLTDAGYEVRYHIKGVVPNSNLEVDMFVPELSVAIEVDGPSHFLPIWGEDSLRKNMVSDIEKNGLLLNQGYVVIRVKQVKNSLSNFIKRQLLTKVIGVLQDINTNFPAEEHRLIEVEA